MRAVENSAHAKLLSTSDLDERIALALGDKAEAFREYRRQWNGPLIDRDFPLHLDFELNAACNLRCPMCTFSDENAVNKGKSSWLSLEHFTQIVTDGVAHGLKSVGLNGVNEPLLRPDLPEFVAAARDAGVLDIMFHTNGTLLMPGISAQLIGAGLTRLFVSLDAATEATYRKIRVGAPSLERIRENIVTFIEMRNKYTLPVVGVCFVKMSSNIHELDEFIEQWREIVDFFAIQDYMNPWSNRADKDAMAVTGATQVTTFTCPQPFKRIKIGAAPTLPYQPCCSFYAEKIPIGTVHDSSLLNAWQAMTDLRTLHREGRYQEHPVCRECVKHSYFLTE